MNMNPTLYEDGMTVAELKALVADLPEKDEYGEPFEVWLGTGGVSNIVKEAWPLNKRESGQDIILTADR